MIKIPESALAALEADRRRQDEFRRPHLRQSGRFPAEARFGVGRRLIVADTRWCLKRKPEGAATLMTPAQIAMELAKSRPSVRVLLKPDA